MHFQACAGQILTCSRPIVNGQLSQSLSGKRWITRPPAWPLPRFQRGKINIFNHKKINLGHVRLT